MISLGYTIAYFLRSGLPWQRTNSKNDHKGYHYDRIHAIKLQFPPRKLFAGFPDEFADYMTVSVDPKPGRYSNRSHFGFKIFLVL